MAQLLLKRRPTFALTEPIVRFHHCVIRPNLTRLEERRAAEVWASAGRCSHRKYSALTSKTWPAWRQYAIFWINRTEQM